MSRNHYNNYSKSYSRPAPKNATIEEVETVIVDEIPEEIIEETPDETKNNKTGIVIGCVKLNIREKPELGAPIVCAIDCLTEVEIDEDNSTREFYKVYTVAGMEGYCMRKYITVKS